MSSCANFVHHFLLISISKLCQYLFNLKHVRLFQSFMKLDFLTETFPNNFVNCYGMYITRLP